MDKPRNWIEQALGRRYAWPPVYFGNKGHRKMYCIRFEDGTEEDYFIDVENKTIEVCYNREGGTP